MYALLMVVMLAAVDVDLVAGNETAAVDAAREMMRPFGLASVGGAIVLLGGASCHRLVGERFDSLLLRGRLVAVHVD
jgi:hypothetical protein